MNRLEVLQKLVNYFNYERYLEIGVHRGRTFLPLRCPYKTGVDPAFRIYPGFFLFQLLKNPANLSNRYYQVTSDKFFAEKMVLVQPDKYPDLVFIDGLHTFRASLKDVLNSLRYLKKGGTIVLHDCFPPNAVAATPAGSLVEAHRLNIKGWSGAWCGDVWKTIVYLIKKYPLEIDVNVLDTDMGLGVLRLKSNGFVPTEIDENQFKDLNALTFDYLVHDPQERIHLKTVDPGDGIFNSFNPS